MKLEEYYNIIYYLNLDQNEFIKIAYHKHRR